MYSGPSEGLINCQQDVDADTVEIANFCVHIDRASQFPRHYSILDNVVHTRMQLESAFLCNFIDTARSPIHQNIFPIGFEFTQGFIAKDHVYSVG